MPESKVPSRKVVSLLQEYIRLMQKYKPDSKEARDFFEANEQVEDFKEHALPLYYEEMEDYHSLKQRFGPSN